jgi:hypothetical protein
MKEERALAKTVQKESIRMKQQERMNAKTVQKESTGTT